MNSLVLIQIPLLLLMGLVLPVVMVARRRMEPWSRLLAVWLGLLALVLLGWLFAPDDYRRDGTTNWGAYDVEYPTLPTVALLVLASRWLWTRPGDRAVVLASPLIAVTASFATFVCFVFTTN